MAIESWADGETGAAEATPVVLASSSVALTAGDDWMQYNFTLTPSKTASCVGITPQGALAVAANITCPVNGTYNPQGDVSDRTAHVCVLCGGQFVLAMEEAGEVNLDYVYLAPGEWGRYKGLPVLAEGVKWLNAMGTTLFRMGGSFCSGKNYFWKRWRGLPWLRPSQADAWGHDFEAGWCDFAPIFPIKLRIHC